MTSIKYPLNFDSQKFMDKFGVSVRDFYIYRGEVFCDKLPDLTEDDLADCIVDLERLQRIKDRESTSQADAKNIPGWASWSEKQALEWADAHISDTQIDAMDNLDEAKVLLKDMSKAIQGISRMEIAIRNKLWPDLPENV